MIGRNVKIEDRTGIICFTSNFNGKDYINVCFDDNDEYKVYEIKRDEKGSYLEPVVDKSLLSSLSAIWIEEELEKTAD